MFQFREKNNTLFDKRGYFAVGIFNPKSVQNVGLLWRAAAIYGADFIFTIGKRYSQEKCDTTQAHLHIPIFNFENFDIMRNTVYPYPNCSIIGVELTSKAQYLHEFTHPDRAIYLFGAEDVGLPDDILNKCHKIIKLPGKISLNVGMAASIVVYDRAIKRMEFKG